MKELAVVKLTKTLFGKVGEKIADKKKKWKQEAALSVEETKRREAEFKEDFTNIQKKLKPEVVKEEIQKSVEATTETVQKIETKVEESIKAEVKKEVAKPTPVKKAEKKLESKVASKKEVEPTKESKPVKKDTTKKETVEKKSAPKTTSTKKKTTPAVNAPSKKEAKLALYSADITKHYGKVDEAFLAIVVKNLGPSIYRKDAELVSCSDPKELDTVRKNFLVKKLQMKESDDVLNDAIKEVCTELKASRNKYRATFYYALAKKFKLESKLS